MKSYITKSVTIDAAEWKGGNLGDAISFCALNGMPAFDLGSIKAQSGLIIETLEGDMVAQPGDFIIKGLKGEYYPCKPDIFHMKYEEA